MAAGRSAPRYERMVLLYPRSQALQSYLSEYFIVIVQICHRAFKFGQKRVLGQIFSAIGDGDANLQSHKADLDEWSTLIKLEVDLLNVEEHRSFFKSLVQSSGSETARRRNEARISILQACSTYDYQTTWKQIRKRGNTSLLNGNEVYLAWKANKTSCTLICTGKLGSGKSVLLANIVDDLNCDVQSLICPVAYFFCRYDLAESLTSNTMLRSLARQLLQPIKELTSLSRERLETGNFPDTFKLFDLLAMVVPPKFQACIIIDGLDACDKAESKQVLKDLQRLQDLFPIRVCLSFRTDFKSGQNMLHREMKTQTVFSIPEENPDIEGFITAELERRLESRHLKIGNPGIIAEIHDALTCGAQGMFLWVVLQIDSLCSARTDESIRQALHDLPGDLPETFTRVLRKSTKPGDKFQTKVLELLTTARRPLTTAECREALSVVVGDTDWNPARLLNDVDDALAGCGSLITVDEEDDTVSFIHNSVVQYLFSDYMSCFDASFTAERAENTMGCIIVTYLNYDVFDTQLSKSSNTQMDGAVMPSKVIRSINLPSTAQSIALRLLRSKGQPNFNLGEALQEAGQAFQPPLVNQFFFLQYAKSNWPRHVQFIAKENLRCFNLVLRLCRGVDINANKVIGGSDWASFMVWAAENGEMDILRAFPSELNLFYRADRIAGRGRRIPQALLRRLLILDDQLLNARDSTGQSLLMLVVYQLLEAGPDPIRRTWRDHKARGEFRGAWVWRWPESDEMITMIIEFLFMHCVGRGIESKDSNGRTALSIASELDLVSIVHMLASAGADLDCKDIRGLSPLQWAIFGESRATTELLVHFKVDVEAEDTLGRSALSAAVRADNLHATRLLIECGANCNSTDVDGVTPLIYAARGGHTEVLRALIDVERADLGHTDKHGRTALSAAKESGNKETVQVLLTEVSRRVVTKTH